MSTLPARPLPQPTTETAAYWAAAQEQQLVIQRCDSCVRAARPPRPKPANAAVVVSANASSSGQGDANPSSGNASVAGIEK